MRLVVLLAALVALVFVGPAVGERSVRSLEIEGVTVSGDNSVGPSQVDAEFYTYGFNSNGKDLVVWSVSCSGGFWAEIGYYIPITYGAPLDLKFEISQRAGGSCSLVAVFKRETLDSVAFSA